MDWDDLRVFMGVAEAGSLSGAARRLRLSQATVWRRIQALEHSLAEALFERRPTGYILTPAGMRLSRRLGPVPRAIENACRELGQDAEAAVGEVRVIAPELIGALVAGPMHGLVAKHPGLIVELLVASPAAALSARDVDIAIRVERLNTAGFVLEATYDCGFGLFASSSYQEQFGRPASIEGLKGHRLIDFDHTAGHLSPERWARTGGKDATVVYRSNSPFSRLAACRAGLGLAMLAPGFVGDDPEPQQVLGADQVGSMDMMMFVNAELRREPRVTAVRDFFAEVLERQSYISRLPAGPR